MEYLIYQENEQYLNPRDAVSMLAKVIPIMTIDWVQGDEIVKRQYQNLLKIDAPDVILTSHISLLDNTACIHVSFPECANGSVHFILQSHQSFVIECSDPFNEKLLTYAAERIATALGYKFAIHSRL